MNYRLFMLIGNLGNDSIEYASALRAIDMASTKNTKNFAMWPIDIKT